MDLIIARENTEGFYADRNMHQGSGEFMPTEDMVLAIRKITRRGSEQIARQACELAAKRRGLLSIVHKANVMKVSDGFFVDICKEVADDYKLEVDEYLVDAMAALLVRKPGYFDVIVTTNMFGDIVTDLASVLQGGMGMAVGANVGDHHGMFGPIDGSAPKHAGKDKVNPIAMILTVKEGLQWLGHRKDDSTLSRAAEAIELAVLEVLKRGGPLTYDLVGPDRAATCSEVGRAIADVAQSRVIPTPSA